MPTRLLVVETKLDKIEPMLTDFVRVQTRQEALYQKQAELMGDMKELERRINRTMRSADRPVAFKP